MNRNRRRTKFNTIFQTGIHSFKWKHMLVLSFDWFSIHFVDFVSFCFLLVWWMMLDCSNCSLPWLVGWSWSSNRFLAASRQWIDMIQIFVTETSNRIASSETQGSGQGGVAWNRTTDYGPDQDWSQAEYSTAENAGKFGEMEMLISICE